MVEQPGQGDPVGVGSVRISSVVTIQFMCAHGGNIPAPQGEGKRVGGVVPGASDFCQFPAPETYEEREIHTVRELPGPAGAPLSYHITVTYDPNVADGTTVFHARFSLPPDEAPDEAPDGPDWEVFEVGDAALGGLGLREERLWFYYEEVRYPNQRSGWVLRHRTEDLLRISLYGEAGETGGSLHLWGDFPIDETIAYP